ncbi:ATP-binding protein [Lachnospiraceae bacterium 42-17]|jgi:signal transduction histidine kinase|nr:sensor histidine kinase [Dorea sp.]
MKKRTFLVSLLFVFLAELMALILFANHDIDNTQDAVLVNEAVQSVRMDWDNMENHRNQTLLDYAVLDVDGSVLFKSKSDLSESINEAVIHRDTILDIQVDDLVVGKIIIYNESARQLWRWKQGMIFIILAGSLMQCGICAGYYVYLNSSIIKPFQELKGFAERIAGGNLDTPMEMDRHNIFGAFTESFDIMRSELKKSRKAEAKANADKRELVAKLSHDIKTPVASIKAASEVGAALTDNEKQKDNYVQIIRKADQINTLITNLFTAALEELKQLSVAPKDMESREIKTLLINADYLRRTEVPDIPECIIYIDKLRLQQVFDNIFANSYKYAGTNIKTEIYLDNKRLAISIEDYGGGIDRDEVLIIKEKYRRGSNVKDVEGAGLGLYISDYFMREMKGELIVENGKNGLKATVMILLSGEI